MELVSQHYQLQFHYLVKASLWNDLKPFGSDDEIIPTISIDGDIQGVRVFNEEFVNNMVFKESTVIDNAFDVFIRNFRL